MTNNLCIKEALTWSTLGETKKIEPRVACRGQLDLTERAWVLELCSLRFKFQGVNLTVWHWPSHGSSLGPSFLICRICRVKPSLQGHGENWPSKETVLGRYWVNFSSSYYVIVTATPAMWPWSTHFIPLISASLTLPWWAFQEWSDIT